MCIRFGRLLVVLALCALASPARVQSQDSLAIRLFWENDAKLPWTKVHSDRYYTNGLRVVASWIAGGAGLGISVGQTMYTPAVITDTISDPLDRPYAGFSSIGAPYAQEGMLLELQVGAFGHWSGASRVQRYWHENISGSPRPEGWEYGLPSEVGVVLRAERADGIEFARSDGQTTFDAQTAIGLTVGNVFDQVMGRIGLRAGHNIPTQWAGKVVPTATLLNVTADSLRGSWLRRNTALYGFVSAELRFVPFNATLDGPLFRTAPCRRANGWQHGPCVSRIASVADFEGGIGARFWRLELTYRRVIRTAEFVGGRTQRFNSGTVGWVR